MLCIDNNSKEQLINILSFWKNYCGHLCDRPGYGKCDKSNCIYKCNEEDFCDKKNIDLIFHKNYTNTQSLIYKYTKISKDTIKLIFSYINDIIDVTVNPIIIGDGLGYLFPAKLDCRVFIISQLDYKQIISGFYLNYANDGMGITECTDYSNIFTEKIHKSYQHNYKRKTDDFFDDYASFFNKFVGKEIFKNLLNDYDVIEDNYSYNGSNIFDASNIYSTIIPDYEYKNTKNKYINKYKIIRKVIDKSMLNNLIYILRTINDISSTILNLN